MSTVMYVLVEGEIDAAVARRIVQEAGASVGFVFPRKGSSYVQDRLPQLNQAAQGIPFLALLDLADTSFECPVTAAEELLPHREPRMLFRLVVQEIESWLLADRAGIAAFLGVRTSLVPHHPEELDDPKKSFVEVARSSRHPALKQDLVPADPTQNDQGPGYTSRMRTFVREKWDLAAAMENAPSLRRCVTAVSQLVDRMDDT